MLPSQLKDWEREKVEEYRCTTTSSLSVPKVLDTIYYFWMFVSIRIDLSRTEFYFL